jgi:hypothetical protein
MCTHRAAAAPWERRVLPLGCRAQLAWRRPLRDRPLLRVDDGRRRRLDQEARSMRDAQTRSSLEHVLFYVDEWRAMTAGRVYHAIRGVQGRAVPCTSTTRPRGDSAGFPAHCSAPTSAGAQPAALHAWKKLPERAAVVHTGGGVTFSASMAAWWRRIPVAVGHAHLNVART